ncbi:uncharacterized protein LOC103185242 [Callorhinchus milii]|uniref:uncharacterized protein LOC103185242 n=1 Tax=Callorhinchus milii TaxID=7868 RepID=UPI0004573927|nr:uncharacterized protein LOC103185242 [Callorhinchus milii]|eukprot:gi/632970772/ref/XP_007901833.1/ PREDICTED: uncharacterized protein LOC103185242 [Callorhinchus milii]
MRLVFQVLGDLYPQLGAFSKVLQLIRDELYNGVYSSQRTGSSVSESEKGDAVTRVPYFSLLHRIREHRNEEAKALRTELNGLREMMLQKEEGRIQLEHTLAEMKQSNGALQDHIVFLKEKIREITKEVKRLQQTHQDQLEKATKQVQSCEVTITEVQGMLQATQGDVASLSQYKKIYDELQEDFQQPRGTKKRNSLSASSTTTPGNRKAVVATKKAHLLSYIEATKQLEHQVLQVQNNVLEEFDAYLESHRTWLATKNFQNNRNDPAFSTEELEILTTSKELAGKQQKFLESMAEISKELALLQQHKESLQQQLNEYEQTRQQERQDEEKPVKYAPHTTQAPGSKITSGSSGLGRGRSILSGLESHPDESLVRDIFSVALSTDEILLNKYAATIHTSCNNGSLYKEVEEATLCVSCAEKTLICPHKIGNNCVIALPKNCTHIKISRPRAHIITMEAKLRKAKKQAPASVCGTANVTTPEASSDVSQAMVDPESTVSEDQANKSKNDSAQPSTPPRACKIQPPQATGSWQGEEKNALESDLSSIWDHFEKGTPFSRVLPRIISLNRCLSVIQHLIANLIWEDEHKQNVQPGSIQETLSALFTDFYIVEEISHLSVFDFVSAVVRYASTNRLIAVFGRTLCGQLDAVVLRYTVLIAELVNSVSWQLVSDFQTFASVVYHLQGEELEEMVMGYVAFSENHISKTLVVQYVLYLILRNSEPLFNKCEASLRQHSGTEPSYLTSTEFAVAFENAAPLCNKKLQQVLVEQSVTPQQSASVSLTTAAQITAYLMLLQQENQHKEHLQTAARKTRNSLKKTLTGSTIESSNRVVPEDEPFITMSRLKLMAGNIARRKRIQMMYPKEI